MKRFFSPISSKLPQSSSSGQNAPHPKKRIPIRDYHPDERDEIRRAYIQRGPHSTSNSRSFLKMKAFIKVESNVVHNRAKKKCEDLMRQEQSIQAAFVKLSNQTKLEHKIRLKASIEVARLLLNQGLAFSWTSRKMNHH
ncbi:hypothetical protein H5410_016113 [Solanum commersonii]|uniref:DUF4371 domain-containing protein n=1 Tax=Solanum commersonii TaxID=4109 RepID=A0A9J5ZVK7_SOLCO|nr:hypothetical protein H5410_016113 [Solanum commersonii]